MEFQIAIEETFQSEERLYFLERRFFFLERQFFFLEVIRLRVPAKQVERTTMRQLTIK